MTTTATLVETLNPLGFSLARMKKSYWDDLDEVARKDCVGNPLNNGRPTYDGKSAWEASGPLRDRWQAKLHQDFKVLCNKNHSKIYKKDLHSSAGKTLELCLLGQDGQKDAARPFVVVKSSNERIARRTVDLLRGHPEIEKLKLGIKFVAYKTPAIRMVAAFGSELGSRDVPSHDGHDTACGSRIISCPVPVHRDSDGKRAVLGGVLVLGNRFYGLTVAHALLKSFQYNDSGYNSSEEGSSFSSDNEDEADDANKQVFLDPLGVTYSSTISAVYYENPVRPNEDVTSVIRASFDKQESASSISLIGHTDATSSESSQTSLSAEPAPESRWFCLDHDWALVEIQDSRFMLPNTFISYGKKSIVTSFCTKQAPTESGLLFLNGSGKTEHVNAPSTIAGISLPWSRDFVDVWIIEHASARGDCGTWVVDTQSEGLFGVVVATSADSSLTYVLPAEDIIDSVLARWKDEGVNVGDLFPSVAASAENVLGYELAPYHDLDVQDEGQVTTWAQIPLSGDFANYPTQYKQQEQAESESTRTPSTAPSDIFDPARPAGRLSFTFSGLTYAQVAKLGERSNPKPRAWTTSDEPADVANTETENEQATAIVEEDASEAQVERAKIRELEAELAERGAAIEQQKKRIEEQNEEIQKLKKTQQLTSKRPITGSTSSREAVMIASMPTPYYQGRASDIAAATLAPVARSGLSKLSPTSRNFARIKAGNFSECLDILNSRPELLEEPANDFLREAADALREGNTDYAKQCIERALIIKECENMSKRRWRLHLQALGKESSPEAKDFVRDSHDALEKLAERLGQPSRLVNPLSPPTLTRTRFLPDDGDRNAHNFSIPHIIQSYTPSRYEDKLAPPGPGTITPRTSTGLDFGRRHTTEFPVSSAATTIGGAVSQLNLDPRYTIRRDTKKFFTVGRVFALLWHEAGSTPDGNPSDRVRATEPIRSSIRRMAVVREEHGACWCVPINTYGGQGVAKRGFNQVDIDAHAVIYMVGTEPKTGPKEPRMSKRPIAVVPGGADQVLDPMSRLNFAKIHTVEHNVKVMNVGRISKDSIAYFVEYWQDQFREGDKGRNAG